jgi:AraC-like DNA-binding protein
MSPGRAALAVRVRKAVSALLGTGNCSRGEVANALFMHPRTMQRRLGEEGTTFEAIKDDARRDLAQSYLSHPALLISQITILLGYTEQSAFGRSCRRWFDLSPREMRTRLLTDSDDTSNA